MLKKCQQLNCKYIQYWLVFCFTLTSADIYVCCTDRGWVRGGGASYYLELMFELGALLLDLLHHIHMLLWCNILLSMASLVICMQLRLLLHQLRARLARHRHRLRLQAYMRTQ